MRSTRAAVAGFLLAFVAGGPLATTAVAQGTQAPAAQGQQQPQTTRREVGDWTVICAAAGKPCAMEQVGKTSQGENALSMQIEKLPQPQTVDGRRIEALGSFLVPPGVLLQPGLRLRIDNGQPVASPYFICQQNGCIVRAPLEPSLIDQFRRGSRASLTFAMLGPNGQSADVTATISLTGFTRAYNSLP